MKVFVDCKSCRSQRLRPATLWAGILLASSAALQAQTQALPVPQQQASVRLGAIVEMARASDAQFAAARAAALSAREKLPQARAVQRPNINLSLSPKRNHDGSTAYPGMLGYYGGGVVLSLSQPLFRLANLANTGQAELLVQLSELQLALAEQELLLRAAKGYFDVLQAQDELAAATAQKDALVQQLAQTKRSLEVGTVPITDFNEAQARHDLAVAQEIAARNEVESKKRVLEKSIVRPLPLLARLKDGITPDLLSPAEQATLVEAAARDSLPVLIGRTATAVAEKEISKREAGHHPTLDLVAAVRSDQNVNYNQFGGSNTRQTSVGLELNVPIYQGGMVSSRTREAMADLERARQDLANAERQALLDAQQAQLGVQSGTALTLALRQALSSGETQLRSTQRGLQVGVRTRVDVLNAEQQLFVIRKDLAVARYRTVVSALQLRAAAGVLAEGDLRQLDALLAE